MKVSIIDLRYRTKDILNALERNESVTVLYHGKVRGIIKPAREKSLSKVKNHPLFGLDIKNKETVIEELGNLRNPRYDL